MPRTERQEVLLIRKPGPHGGPRPNSGRKPKDEVFAKPVRQAEKRIADHLPNLVDRMMELANGVHVIEHTADGEIRRYQRPPDREAIKYLMDRILGRPTERKEVDKKVEHTVRAQIFLPDNGRPKTLPPGEGEAPVIDAEFREG